MAYIDPASAGNPYATPNGAAPRPPGYVYIPGLGVVPADGPAWSTPDYSGHDAFAWPAVAPVDDEGTAAGLQPFEIASDDWGIAEDGLPPAPGYDAHEGLRMHPYAGSVPVDPNAIVVDRTPYADHWYDQAAFEAWNRAQMTPDEIEAERLRLLEEQ